MATLLAQFSAHFPVWNTIRAAGLTSYLLMFVSVAAGISHSFSFLNQNEKTAFAGPSIIRVVWVIVWHDSRTCFII